MKSVLLIVFMTVQVGGVFGDASADAGVVSSGEIEVVVRVEVAGRPSSVIAHFVDPGDDQSRVALALDATGAYVGTARVERADLVVVFEAIWSDATSDMSRPLTLLELGVDPQILIDESADEVSDDGGIVTLDATTERWGWAALALGATALALLAWWALADYPRRSRQSGAADQA